MAVLNRFLEQEKTQEYYVIREYYDIIFLSIGLKPFLQYFVKGFFKKKKIQFELFKECLNSLFVYT